MEIRNLSVDKKSYLMVLLICLTFVAISAYMIFADSSSMTKGVLIIVFFSGVIVFGVFPQLRATEPRLLINEEGVNDKFLGCGLIKYSDIESAQIQGTSIKLVISNVDSYVKKAPPIVRILAPVNKICGYSPLNLNCFGLEANTKQIFDMFKHNYELATSGKAIHDSNH